LVWNVRRLSSSRSSVAKKLSHMALSAAHRLFRRVWQQYLHERASVVRLSSPAVFRCRSGRPAS
jgi:hypothetical protein